MREIACRSAVRQCQPRCRNAEYLSDGITESVINNLSQLSGLRVMSRNSAFRFKNNQTDTKNIASQLGVETLVTGDIKQIGDRLVINVRLIDATRRFANLGQSICQNFRRCHRRAKRKSRKPSHSNLRLKLTNAEQKQLGKNYTENAEAYELYLRGRFHYFKITEPEIRKSIAFLPAGDSSLTRITRSLMREWRTLTELCQSPAGTRRPKKAFPQAKAAA
ncbi:MAG: hypothetical protein WKF71_11465 [Pyrinomonadaceae bacterium]